MSVFQKNPKVSCTILELPRKHNSWRCSPKIPAGSNVPTWWLSGLAIKHHCTALHLSSYYFHYHQRCAHKCPVDNIWVKTMSHAKLPWNYVNSKIAVIILSISSRCDVETNQQQPRRVRLWINRSGKRYFPHMPNLYTKPSTNHQSTKSVPIHTNKHSSTNLDSQ